MTASSPDPNPPLACSLDDRALAIRANQLQQELFTLAEDRQELPDGFAYRFPGTDEWLTKLTDFIADERRCCPFFRFELALEPDFGPIWLTFRGPAGVKEFVLESMTANPSI